ncbi:hypothetical protein ACFWY9_17235 [Amycolatopsis sp. NPDC059027]|uniref:hypothetical protein n=1 Tax=Amycolatopsis sp. NPDC059027 TaxID=3346709 RepID=UPI00366BDDFA
MFGPCASSPGGLAAASVSSSASTAVSTSDSRLKRTQLFPIDAFGSRSAYDSAR